MDTRRVLAGRHHYSDCLFLLSVLTIGNIGRLCPVTLWFPIYVLAVDYGPTRAMPPITLVSGYLLPFFEWNLWGILPTTIIVLVAINQPFTLWMLHSFFQSIPKDLDESAKVDGCTQFQAFRFVIIPVMWLA